MGAYLQKMLKVCGALVVEVPFQKVWHPDHFVAFSGRLASVLNACWGNQFDNLVRLLSRLRDFTVSRGWGSAEDAGTTCSSEGVLPRSRESVSGSFQPVRTARSFAGGTWSTSTEG